MYIETSLKIKVYLGYFDNIELFHKFRLIIQAIELF